MKLSVKEVCKEKGLTIQDLADKMEIQRLKHWKRLHQL